MNTFTRRQAELHPSIRTDGFRDIEEYVLFKSQEFDYQVLASNLRGKRVLDWGCNNGYGTKIAAREADVIGIDVSEKLIGEARELWPGVQFSCCDGVNSGFANNEFDAVLLFQTIEHILNPVDVLNEIMRILKPNGVVYITTPNAIRLQGGRCWNPFHAREYDCEGLAHCVSQVFPQVKVEGLTAVEAVRSVELNRLEKRRYRRLLQEKYTKMIVDMINRECNETFLVARANLRFEIQNSEGYRAPSIEEIQRLEAAGPVFYYTENDLSSCLALRCTALKL